MMIRFGTRASLVGLLSISAPLLKRRFAQPVACSAAVGPAAPISPFMIAATYNANNPTEDRLVYDTLVAGWHCGAVFDGHGGWNVSDMASKSLPQLIEKRIREGESQGTVKPMQGGNVDQIGLDEAIVKAFEDCEQAFVGSVRESYRLGFGSVASVGSCVLVALLQDNHLILANCGDCRAVLGTAVRSKGKERTEMVSTRLTSDHNARVALEVQKLQREHPGEADVVVCRSPHACYVKGRLQLTRSIGDLYLKYHEFNAPSEAHRSRGRRIPEPYTPPYVSHVPDVTHINLDKHDRFVILASDGLWDFLTDKEAVSIVGNCQDRKMAASRLVEEALRKASENSSMSLSQLLDLPAGKERRNRHDDTSVVVIFFQ